MQTSTLSLSTLTGSTIRASFLTLSTLTVSSINGALPGSGSSTWLTGTGGIIYYNGGNVGIGTSINIANFQVYGATNPNITLGNSTYPSDFQIGMASAGGNYSGSAIAGDTVIRTISGNLMLQAMGGGNAAIYISKTNNNVGIGMVSPGYPLHVNGAIFATGDITAYSDQRYKQNIVRLDHSLDKILQLGGYSYTREDYRPGERQIGLLAQEVKAVFPEAVSHDSINDKYSVNYNCLMAPVVEAIKELQDQIQSQQSVIQSLLDRLGPQ